MGDDPLIPQPLVQSVPLVHADAVSGQGGSAATGGANYTFNTGLSKGNQMVVVVIACLALGLSIGGLVMLAWGQSMERERNRDQIAAVEKRAMDAVYLAQQTGALAREDVRVLVAELAKQKIVISTSH